MKIVAFTGAGISRESGIKTFRDNDGLWNNFSIEEVATKDAWTKNPQKVLDFYNQRRSEIDTVSPNDAHKYLKKLEEKHDVTIITQNIDDLHERVGSSKILHLHGEMRKMRSDTYEDLIYDYNEDIKMGDKCEQGFQLRPHVVWFGELPYNVEESYQALSDCDLLLIIGTSLNITYTLDMLSSIDEERTEVIYIDPNPDDFMDGITHVTYIKENATRGVKELVEELLQ